MNTAIIIGAITLAILAGKKPKQQGIGKAKRRIYRDISNLQDSGIDLSQSWELLDREERQIVNDIAHFHEHRYGDWKSSSRSSKSAGEQYYNSLRRAYNQITGIGATDLVPIEYSVKNEYGDTVVIYRDYGSDEDRMRNALLELRPDRIMDYNDAYFATICYIAEGGKFIWSDKLVGGVKEQIFAGSGKHDTERKARISYLATKAKGGRTPTAVAHSLWEMGGGALIDDMEILDAVNEVLLSFESVGQARQYVYDRYIGTHTLQDWTDMENNATPF